jgi:peptidoglycan hydrolase-like protein with peptidoglycan-binding domain
MAEAKRAATTAYLETPRLTVEAGYNARLLVPPGTFYDPLFPIAGEGDDLWLNDDGGEEEAGEGGGGIYCVDRQGGVRPLVPVGKIPPPTAIDRAPSSFAPYAGQIFALTQPKKGWAGATSNHLIMRMDPRNWEPIRFAELPRAGTRNEGTAGAGVDMRFGPDGTKFAGRLFGVTLLNNSIYEVTPDGTARAFVTMETARPRQPVCLTFAKINGEDRMIVSTANGNFSPRRQVPGFATITQITPDGQVLPEFIAEGLLSPSGLGYAPDSFGAYSGDLFVADLGGMMPTPAPRDNPPPRLGRVLRIDKTGAAHIFAEGFASPLGLRFIGNRMIVCDVNGDYIGGGIELPDGFVVEITAA